MKKLKNRKAPEADNISKKLINYAGPELVTKMTTLSIHKKYPTTGMKLLQYPIFKKGQKSLPENCCTH